MSLLKCLKEELESAKIMAGRSNIFWDEAKGSYECFFKGKDGNTYQFLAVSENETYDDTNWKISMSRKTQGDTETISEEVENDFVEAISEWVNLRNPTSFFFLSSELYPAYNNIANSLSKKIKEYNFIDESKQTHEDMKYDVIEEAPETLVKRFIFTKTEPKEELDKEYWEQKLDDNAKTFDKFTKPEEIKPNSDFQNPMSKSNKLDNGIDYNIKKLA